jgi:tetratricopeptide (TPR) repeat protein
MSHSIFAKFNTHLAGPAMAGILAITQMGPAYAQDMGQELVTTADSVDGQSYHNISGASAYLVMNEARKRQDYDVAFAAARVLLAEGTITQTMAATIPSIAIFANAWDEAAALGETYPEFFEGNILVEIAQFTIAVRDGDIERAVELLETGAYSPYKEDFKYYYENYRLRGADEETAFEDARANVPLMAHQALINGFHSDEAPEYVMNVLAAIEASPDYILKDIALGLVEGYFANTDTLGFENNAAAAITHLTNAVTNLTAQHESGNITSQKYGDYMRIVMSTSYNLLAIAPEMVLELAEYIGKQEEFQVGARYHNLRLDAASELGDYDIMADASKALRTLKGGQYEVTDWSIVYARAEALLNQGHAQYAAEEIETFLNIYAPMFADETFKNAHAVPYFYLNLEAAYLQLQQQTPNLDKAENFLNQAASIDENSPYLHKLYGQVALARGDAEGAIASFQNAMGLTSSYYTRRHYGHDQDMVAIDPELNEDLADSYALSGNNASAMFYWQRALNMHNLSPEFEFDAEEVRGKVDCMQTLGNATSCLVRP